MGDQRQYYHRTHARALNTSTTDRTNFLSGGDTYERIMSRQLGHDLKISTSNGFSLKPEENLSISAKA